MRGILERTFVANTRVDARDMATVARWLVESGGLRLGRVTKSSVLSIAIETLAQMVNEQFPQLGRVETLEQAYEVLSELGLLPSSRQAMLSFARGLKAESLASNDRVDFNEVRKLPKGCFTGQGWKGQDLQAAMSRDANLVMNQLGQNAGGWEAEQRRRMSLSERQVEYEVAKDARDAMIEHFGMDPEEAQKEYQKRIKELDEKYAERTKETIRRGIEVREQMKQAQPKLSHEQLETKALEGLAQSYKTYVTSGMWQRQGIDEPEKKFFKDCVQKVWHQLNPQATEQQLMEVYVQATELAAQLPASEAGTTQAVVDTDLTPEQRAARERAEAEEMKRALAGGA